MRDITTLIFIALGLLCIYANTACTNITAIPEEPVVKKAEVAAKVEAVRLPALEWGDKPSWTKATVEALKLEFPNFEKALDIKRFCPAWKELLPGQKVTALTHLVAAIAKRESNFNPKSKYQEPPPPKGPGTLSAGLLQISVSDSAYGGRCKALTAASIYDPILNLECGVHMMGSLVKRDSVIQNSANRGLARYWSVIRNGHHVVEIVGKVSALDICRL